MYVLIYLKKVLNFMKRQQVTNDNLTVLYLFLEIVVG